MTNEVFALVDFPLWLHLCFQFSLLWFGVQHGWNLCCVWLHNRQEKGGNISFFHFPHKNPPVLKQWANAVNRLHWFPKDYSLICSVHFKESCFIVRPGKRGRLLKDGAVPTEFPTHPSHLQHQTRKRKSPKKRDIQEPLMNESPLKVKKRIVNEHSYSTPKMSPSKTIKKLSTQVRTLQQKVRR